MRVCGYLRTATRGDGSDASPLEEQRRLVVELAAEQGFPVQAWFIDEAADGNTELQAREAGAALLAAVAGGVYHAVMVLRVDRLGRDRGVFDRAVQAISDAGGHVRVLTL